MLSSFRRTRPFLISSRSASNASFLARSMSTCPASFNDESMAEVDLAALSNDELAGELTDVVDGLVELAELLSEVIGRLRRSLVSTKPSLAL